MINSAVQNVVTISTNRVMKNKEAKSLINNSLVKLGFYENVGDLFKRIVFEIVTGSNIRLTVETEQLDMTCFFDIKNNLVKAVLSYTSFDEGHDMRDLRPIADKHVDVIECLMHQIILKPSGTNNFELAMHGFINVFSEMITEINN